MSDDPVAFADQLAEIVYHAQHASPRELGDRLPGWPAGQQIEGYRQMNVAEEGALTQADHVEATRCNAVFKACTAESGDVFGIVE